MHAWEWLDVLVYDECMITCLIHLATEILFFRKICNCSRGGFEEWRELNRND